MSAKRQKGWFCRDKSCKFALWKENRFFQTLGKQMTEELAKQLKTMEFHAVLLFLQGKQSDIIHQISCIHHFHAHFLPPNSSLNAAAPSSPVIGKADDRGTGKATGKSGKSTAYPLLFQEVQSLL